MRGLRREGARTAGDEGAHRQSGSWRRRFPGGEERAVAGKRIVI